MMLVFQLFTTMVTVVVSLAIVIITRQNLRAWKKVAEQRERTSQILDDHIALNGDPYRSPAPRRKCACPCTGVCGEGFGLGPSPTRDPDERPYPEGRGISSRACPRCDGPVVQRRVDSDLCSPCHFGIQIKES
jgi:hypothetical protein